MCCFSGPVDRVADTRIFARHSRVGTQFLVYSMTYAAKQEVAMILPIPTIPLLAEPLRFINLSAYPDFFDDMNRGFPRPPALEGIGRAGFGAGGAATLPVHEVGDFVASFVPTIDDFRRLDRRFTLPRQTWLRIPAYQKYSFAVFQLLPTSRGKKVHPMAFDFVTAMPDRLYFPTVHIHDGQVHPREHFDHALYFQASRIVRAPASVAASSGEAQRFLDMGRVQGVVAGAERCFKMSLQGMLRNQDTLVRVA